MVQYKQEFLNSVKNDIHSLLELDWKEIEHNKTNFPLDPDWDMYHKLEELNILRIFTCRDGDRLVGYFVPHIIPNIHSRGNIIAVAEIIYVLEEYRSGMTGYKLFKFAEKCIKEDGVKILHVTTTEKNPIDPMMKRLGYSKVETKFEKVLS